MMLLFSAVLIVIAAGVIWGHRDPSKWRTLAFLGFTVTAMWAALESMGTPKYYTFLKPKAPLIVAAEYEPEKWIFIWTRGNPPVAYRLNWDEKLAEQIEGGLRRAKEEGRPGVLFVEADYGKFEVHPPPVRERPHKP